MRRHSSRAPMSGLARMFGDFPCSISIGERGHLLERDRLERSLGD